MIAVASSLPDVGLTFDRPPRHAEQPIKIIAEFCISRDGLLNGLFGVRAAIAKVDQSGGSITRYGAVRIIIRYYRA